MLLMTVTKQVRAAERVMPGQNGGFSSHRNAADHVRAAWRTHTWGSLLQVLGRLATDSALGYRACKGCTSGSAAITYF